MDRRNSVRTYSPDLPEGEILERVKRIVEKTRKGPFGNFYSMTLFDINDEQSRDLGQMTSYGIIKNASLYFSGYCSGDDHSIIDFGYCFEEVILELTALELGTCWLGGTFGRGFVAARLGLPEGKVIPAVSPVGYIGEKKALADHITRFVARSENRKTHSKFIFRHKGDSELVPLNSGDLESPLYEALEAVRFGPSASNRQPWRMVIDNNLIHFYCEYNKAYNAVIRGFKIQALDMGIALCHFVKAAEELRMGGKPLYSDPRLENLKWKYILSWKIGR